MNKLPKLKTRSLMPLMKPQEPLIKLSMKTIMMPSLSPLMLLKKPKKTGNLFLMKLWPLLWTQIMQMMLLLTPQIMQMLSLLSPQTIKMMLLLSPQMPLLKLPLTNEPSQILYLETQVKPLARLKTLPEIG